MKGQKKRAVRILSLSLFVMYLSSVSYAQTQEPYSFVKIKSSITENNKLKFADLKESNERSGFNGLYNEHLGAFCKLENKLNFTSHIPIRMRLGTVQYVDRIEHKLPAYMLTKLESN